MTLLLLPTRPSPDHLSRSFGCAPCLPCLSSFAFKPYQRMKLTSTSVTAPTNRMNTFGVVTGSVSTSALRIARLRPRDVAA